MKWWKEDQVGANRYIKVSPYRCYNLLEVARISKVPPHLRVLQSEQTHVGRNAHNIAKIVQCSIHCDQRCVAVISESV